MLSITLLGGFSIKYNEIPVKGLDTSRLQALLVYLVLHQDTPQPREQLAYLFWPDTSETQARTNLRNLLHHLRHALPHEEIYLQLEGTLIQWVGAAPHTLDVDEFNKSQNQVDLAYQNGDIHSYRTALERAVALYKGDLLPSCYEDWIIPKREMLRQAYINTLEKLMQFLEEQREYPAAIQNAQQMILYDPLHEASYRQLMRLHAINGDRASALRVYHTCASTLKRELDVKPSNATQEIYEQLLGSGTLQTTMAQTTPSFSPLIGRQQEWMLLMKVWQNVLSQNKPHVLMISGEAGIGKTRLMEEFLQWAARQGISQVNTRCFSAEGQLAYAPVIAFLKAHPLSNLDNVWLTEVARLWPDLLTQHPDLPKPAALTEAWQRQRLFEAISRVILSTNKTILLTFDDLQWCDRDTLEWIHYLLHYENSSSLLLVGTFRPEEIGENKPLVNLRQALANEGKITEIDLGPLDQSATRKLAGDIAGKAISEQAAKKIYRETEGNPLFVVEMTRVGFSTRESQAVTGEVQQHETEPISRDTGLPSRVYALLAARLSQLSPSASELAGLAATIGREFSFKLLEMTSGYDEDTLVRELDELWQRRIIRESGIDAYDFSHDKLREVAYHGMSLTRRRINHLHIAQALEKIYADALGTVSSRLAAHYEQAGKLEKAVAYTLRAAEVAHAVYANDEAVMLLKHGLSLADTLRNSGQVSEAIHQTTFKMWEALGDVLALILNHDEALSAYHHAQGYIADGNRIAQSRLHRKVGAIFREQRRYTEDLSACHEAEIALGSEQQENSELWWDEWLEVKVEQVWANYWLGNWHEMEALVNEVSPIVHQRGTQSNRMRLLMASCLMHLRRERYTVSDEMLANSREALAASQECGKSRAEVECQFELGFLHLWRREFNEAERHLKSALDLATMRVILPVQTICLTYLTVLYRFKNQMDEVMVYAERAHQIAQTAHMPDYIAAAYGNQAWIAWRKRDLITAEKLGREALKIWSQSPLVYPFQWQALWPLLAVSLEQNREGDGFIHIHALLEPAQQQLPAEINNRLERALRAKQRGHNSEGREHLDKAILSARDLGYL